MIAESCWSLSGMEPEADAIARALRRREPDFLHGLIVQYQHRLLRYLVHLSGSRDLAMDLFQETWVRVLERGHHYDGRSAFSTWLYTLARNLTIDHLRRKNPLSLDGLLQDGEKALVDATDNRPSAWELVAQGQQGELISAALADLPTQYREAIVLRFMDDLPLDEIAAVAAVPLSTVKSRLYRGMDLLTKRLGDARV